ncbi:hypothetical protein KVR01_012904 [Diaporthe batatas]|uniref:uncharacterized protein n=1 Tax=Diaporthe batatas TaxID=748121 RepID=UPI001D03E8B7|nr:uncharacterized protein KVR01_012904 [Diaporthe batatas]KAG8157196.1 hypothetical protein KVR01_012904 [Diaporthe batatas]
MSMSFWDSWEEPEDGLKRPSPYVEDFRATIETHVAPPPFGHSGYNCRDKPRERVSMYKLMDSFTTQSEHVLRNPPINTIQRHGKAIETAELVIMEPLAIGDNRGAQVVSVSVTPSGGKDSFCAVAKIFDAMYYPFRNQEWGHAQDVVYLADVDYSREASAMALAEEIGEAGRSAPKFYGSWTFSLRVPGRSSDVRTRPVRLVLSELLEGPSMYKLFRRTRVGSAVQMDAYHLPLEYRLEVVARVLEGRVRQLHGGLDQNDLAPRNIIIVPHPDTQPPGREGLLESVDRLRVVLVDYRMSIVYRLSKWRSHPFEKLELPPNPMENFWDQSLYQFRGWIPPEWDQKPSLQQQWLVQRFGGNEMINKYAPIAEELKFAIITTKSVATAPAAGARPEAASNTAKTSTSHANATTSAANNAAAEPVTTTRSAAQSNSSATKNIDLSTIQPLPPMPDSKYGFKKSPLKVDLV